MRCRARSSALTPAGPHARSPAPMSAVALAFLVSACSHPPPLVRRASGAPRRAFAISGVRVFDGEALLPAAMDVVVRDGRIRSVSASGALPLPPDVEVTSGAGRTLLPGLWDAHSHIGDGTGAPPWLVRLPDREAQGEAYLFAGVTHVLAASAGVPRSYVERVERGELLGPRVLRSTRVLSVRGGHPGVLVNALFPWYARAFVAHRLSGEADTEEEGRALVRDEVTSLAPDFVKLVYDSTLPGTRRLPLPVLRAMIAEARALDRRVLVHIGSNDEAVDAAEAGATVVMHAPWEGVLTAEQVARIKATGAAVVTTASFFDTLDAGLRGTLALSALERAVLPAGFEEAFAHPPSDWRPAGLPQSFLDSMPAHAATVAENVRRLDAAGVPLLAGSDAGLFGILHGASLHRELFTLVRAGLSTTAVLRMATARPSDFLAPGRGTGHIAPGALADLVLIDGNPLERILDLDAIVGVWLGGQGIERVTGAAR